MIQERVFVGPTEQVFPQKCELIPQTTGGAAAPIETNW